MKIIQAMKSIKDLQKKAEDLRDKVKNHCALLDIETPTYTDQRRQVSEWLQAHGDIVKEIGSLKFRIQKTNIMTEVEIELGGKHVKKSIAEWICRRKDLANLELTLYRGLTNRGLQDRKYQLTGNAPEQITKVVLFFDPVERDAKSEIYRSEPSKIDGTLEIINAVTDLL